MENLFTCSLCKYITKREYNLIRHLYSKHNISTIEYNNITSDINPNIEPNIESNLETNIETNIEPNYLYCNKCYKKYKCLRSLKNHEENCNSIDNLTCNKCMTTFVNRQSKYRHIKVNKCKPKSIIHYQNPNHPSISNSNVSSSYNNTTNSNNTTNNNNCNNNITININDYGKERNDYITFDVFYKILRSVNIIPNYIENKHFNPNYPENHNIKYENNTCLVKKNNKWKKTNISSISSDLFVHNSREINKRYNDFITIIDNIIKDPEIIEQIRNKIDHNFIELSNKILYNRILNDIKDILKAQ